MKRRSLLWSFVLTLVVLLVVFPASAFADRTVTASGDCGAQGDNLTWTLYDDGELVISGTGDMADYSFSANLAPWYKPPADGEFWKDTTNLITSLTVEEGVTSIGECAFSRCADLTDISFPTSLREIRNSAFSYCRSLSDLLLPEGIVTIGSYSFGNTNIDEITFPASLQTCQTYDSGDATFGNTPLMNIYVSPDSMYFCSLDGVVFSKDQSTLIMFPVGRTGSYTVPDGVSSLGLKAFDASHLDTVVLADSLITINDSAFQSAWLRSITIPPNVTDIGSYAFFSCPYLTDITIPASVNRIGTAALSTCFNLVEIRVEDDNSNYCVIDDCLYSADGKLFLCCPGGKNDCITISDSVERISNMAFSNCTKLPSVTFTGDMPIIDKDAFWRTNTTIHYPIGNATYTTDNMLDYGGTLTWKSVRIVRASGNCGAQGDNLTWTLYDDGELVISGTGDMANYHASNGNGSPWYTPENENYWWSNNANLITSLIVEEGVTSLGEWAFSYCADLQDVSLPSSLREIRWGTFDGCRNLSEIELPEGLEVISSDSFANTNLHEITFPASLKDCQGNGSGDSTFQMAPLKNIYVVPNNPYFCSVDGVVFSKDQSTLVMFPTGRTGSYTVPEGVSSLGLKAFDGSHLGAVVLPESLKVIGNLAFQFAWVSSITIPENVTEIGYAAFYSCSRLTRISIPHSVTSIGRNAFSSCGNLTEIMVANENEFFSSIEGCLYNADAKTLICCPGGASGHFSIRNHTTCIGIDAFCGCSNLTSITIPDSVSSIDPAAFANCSKLTSITFSGDIPLIGGYAFGQVTATVYYPANNPTFTAETMQNYGGMLRWVAVEMQPVPDCVLPASLKALEDEALAGCAFLYVRIPDGVTTIGKRAFADSSKLEYVSIPSSVTKIAPDAFDGAPNGLAIIGHAGSTAESFAAEKGFSFVPAA